MNGFDDFIEGEFRPVIHYLTKKGASLEEAKDATQDAILQALILFANDKWHTVRDPREWLRAVAWRSLLRPPSEARKRILTTPLSTAMDPEAIESDHSDRVVQIQDILALLRDLPELERTVLALGLDGLRTAEIAARLNLSEQRVRDVRKAAKRQLRDKHPALNQENFTRQGRSSR
ncbi:hypothetical protein Acor_10450 [Acrocarpospora corrugata]|uniref:RNA polymerase sigma factor 70 region 4 type 2 domain-containing protein n=1 Tax=Acrocarpospora corrugata TaxID=35763 RepID=A0A5M3VTI7_9ACTN|nr:sigma-70 family RNA polymerase sigma factor [Acrocarpospora corrugata]GER98981.1 hypothetical protein Acor_10450 [Acrocarpospora corrugata]